MRSTVSDSSGNPENREDPEYGEERYGAVPVREWVGPDGAGRVTDAWAAAGERAGAGGWALQDEPADRGMPLGREAGPGAPVPGPAVMPGAAEASGPDSVVDLVLDLVPGKAEREHGGSGFGATSASVSVPASVTGSAVDATESAVAAEAAHRRPVFRPAAGAEAGAGAGKRPPLRDAGAHVSELLPGPAPESGPVPGPSSGPGGPAHEVREVRESHEGHGVHEVREVREVQAAQAVQSVREAPDADDVHEVHEVQEVNEVNEVHEVQEVNEVNEVHEVQEVNEAYGTHEAPETPEDHELREDHDLPEVPDLPEVSKRPDLHDLPELPDPHDPHDLPDLPEASASVSGPGPAPASASVSLMFTGEDTGEFRTDARVDTGRHQAVIANERTASIPVHLLFRQEPEARADATALPAGVVRKAPGGEQSAGERRPPVPRTPQVRPSTRPSPVADPRLHERPGPSLPGWVALLTGFGGIAAIGGALWWTGALPARVLSRIGVGPRPYDGLGIGTWAALALLVTLVLFAFGGLSRGRVGYTWVLTLFGRYRGSVRRTGLMWVSPLLLRRRVDVRLRHWRSEPLPAMDANGTALRVVVLVVWRVKDTVRATLGIEDHEEYLREQVEAAMARVLSQLPADAFHEDAHTLRNAEAVGDALTRMLKADCEPVGVEVYSAQPTGIEYAPEVAAAMQRRRIAAIDAKYRDSVLTSVVDAVDDTVNRLTARGLVELDDYERKALVKDLTVAFYTGRTGGDSA
ncbi:SPFH domain-containing protein [Streptomyces sp. NBC_01013]|uniref:SPFH domain-containing protein n=1 Tax=Streptomyces sp. NBC_01013 TaxID=2903718 RepID=UPI00386965CA|nr:SPFH domain-containing protein [Streptomyces sp. NBC_01013]